MELHDPKDGLLMSEQDPAVTGILTALQDKRDEAVQNRAEVESRWLRDLQQFEGNTLDRLTKGDTDYRSAVKKAPPVVHLTRSRTLSIAARIINMLVPSNERSWNIEATPVPKLARLAEDTTPVTDPRTGQVAMVPDEAQQPGPERNPMASGHPMQGPGIEDPAGAPEAPMRPVTKADLAKMQLDEAEKRASRMREHMDDQLTECSYNAEQRKLILDGCKLGTGILEGPVIGGSFKKARYRLPDGTWVTQIEEQSAPEYRCIDPWNFYPIPAEHITKSPGVFIDNPMTRRELQGLKLRPFFNVDMISEVLRETPEQSEHYQKSMVNRANITGETIPTDKRYTVWKYVGSLDRDDMENLGIDLDDELDVVDPIIEAWFVNSRLIKVKRHPMEGCFRLPYYVWCYEESETSIFGYGVPYFMRDSDRVIQATWHMILHNAALASGSQVVRKKGAIEPVDGTEEITGGVKQWYWSDTENIDIRHAFQTFEFPVRLEELTAVHERARENADEELAFPLIAQGEPTESVPTHSGLALLMNASNVVQRRIAQSYDDEILEPSVTALYDFNMIYLDDDDAKGDMTIKAMGATKLVVKDMQAQHLLTIADVTTNDRFAPFMKDQELLREILKAAETDPDQLMLSEEEIANLGPSEREQLELEKLKAEIEEMQANTGGGAMNESDHAELQYRYDKLQTELQIQQMKLEEAALEASRSDDVKLADIQAKFELGKRQDDTKRLIAQLEDRRKQAAEGYMAGLKTEELRQKRQNLSMGFDTHG